MRAMDQRFDAMSAKISGVLDAQAKQETRFNLLENNESEKPLILVDEKPEDLPKIAEDLESNEPKFVLNDSYLQIEIFNGSEMESSSKFQTSAELEMDNKNFLIEECSGKVNFPRLSDFNEEGLGKFTFPDREKAFSLSKAFVSPFKVVGRNGNNYDLVNYVTNKQYTYHIKKIHPFYYDKVNTDPIKVAMLDNEFYDVKKVDTHKFIGNKRKIKDNLELFMRFEDDPEHTWYGWNSTYNDVAVIQDYFKKNKLNHFLLNKYK